MSYLTEFLYEGNAPSGTNKVQHSYSTPQLRGLERNREGHSVRSQPGQSPEVIDSDIRPPSWVRDEYAPNCMAMECGLEFDFFNRRHHCRYCGGVFCHECSNRYSMLPEVFNTHDPQRTCQICYAKLRSIQADLIENNSNAERSNKIEEDSVMRYVNSPIRFTLGGEIRKAAYTMQNLIDGIETTLEDSAVTMDLFKDCSVIMFITVANLAFVGGLRFGTGLVISRVSADDDGKSHWSAPCAVYMVGLSFGAQFGAEVTDMVIPLHDKDAIDHFSVKGGSHAMVGGEASLAVGPVGRTGEAALLASTRGIDTAVTYSQSRGLYFGVTLEGAIVQVRDDVNQKYYGYDVHPAGLLNGSVPAPINASPLLEKLDQYEAILEDYFPCVTPVRPSRPSSSYTTLPSSSNSANHDLSNRGPEASRIQSHPSHPSSENGKINADSNSTKRPLCPSKMGQWDVAALGNLPHTATNHGIAKYQSLTPEQQQQAIVYGVSTGNSAYQSLTPEQQHQAIVYGVSTGNSAYQSFPSNQRHQLTGSGVSTGMSSSNELDVLSL